MSGVQLNNLTNPQGDTSRKPDNAVAMNMAMAF